MSQQTSLEREPKMLKQTSLVAKKTNSRRVIAYSTDALVPGFYFWLGSFSIRIGGCEPEENYSGTVNSFAGLALVLPDYRIFTTYKGSYDPR